jgi:hypothetical protein
MLLIAAILRSRGDKLLYKAIKKEHKKLLPSKDVLKYLGLIYTISSLLYEYLPKAKFEFALKQNTLTIKSDSNLELFKQEIQKLKLPKDITIKI